MNKRKIYQSDYKLQVVLASLQRDTTIEQVRIKYQVSTSVINKWKSIFKQNGYLAFEAKGVTKKKKPENSPDCLKSIIGQLTVENTLLKKALSVWN